VHTHTHTHTHNNNNNNNNNKAYYQCTKSTSSALQLLVIEKTGVV